MKTAYTGVDEALIERCIKGDQDAWQALIARYQRLVYSVAYTLCPNPEDVSDIFQQVWLELHQQLGDLRDVNALPAWLMTVTRRRAFTIIKSRHPSAPLDHELPDVSERLHRIENEHMLERALVQLSERCRKLIDLLYFDTKEPSYLEISQTMGMPEASIGPTRARCLDKLRKLMD